MEAGESGLSGRAVPSPVGVGGSRESGTAMTRSRATEAGTVGRTSVRVEAVTQSLVSVSCFRTFITLFDRKRFAVKLIDSGIE